MKQITTVAIFLFSICAFSQGTQTESIESTLKEITDAKSDTTKSRLYTTLAIAYRKFDIHQSDSVSQIAFDLALRSGDNYYVAKSLDNIAYNDIYKGEFDLGILKLRKALQILSADTINIANNDFNTNSQLARIYNDIGMAHDYKSEYSQSIKHYLSAREIFRKIGKKDGEAVAENNLGITYLFAGDFEKSEKHFTKSFNIYMEDVKDTSIAYQAKMNLGIIAYYKGDTTMAMQIYRETAAVMKKIGNMCTYGHCCTNMAEVFQESGEYDSAFYYLEKSITVDKELNDKEGLETDYRIMGSLYLAMKNYHNSRIYYNMALDISLAIGRTFDIKECYNHLYEVEESAGNFKRALEYHILMTAYQDTLMEESNSKVIGKMEAEHEFNQQLAVNEAEHQQNLKIEAEKRRRQSLILYFVFGFIGVIMFFVYMLLKSLRQTRKQKTLVEEAHLEIEQKNEEMVASITYAKRIQNAILPPNSMLKQFLPDAFILYLPKDIVAGDFYWLEVKDETVLFAAADCTGHGVPGAMVSVVCNNGLNRSVREYGLTDPGKILDKTREIVVAEFEKSEEEVKDGMDIALCSLQMGTSATLGVHNAEKNTHSHSLKYAGANNPLFIIRKDSNEIEEYRADKQPIGKFEDSKPYTTHKIEINRGDIIYIFSA